jgi:hypothetical protein
MSNSNTGLGTEFDAGYQPPVRTGANVGVAQTYKIDYAHPDGTSWTDTIHNIVPNVALNNFLDVYYGASAKPGSMYTFLVTGPGASNTYAAGDTMSSHAGWTESVVYSDATRPSCTWGSSSGQAISNSASPSTFNINNTGTIAGCGLTTVNTKSGTTGTLVGVGNFSGGDRSVASGGTLTVTVTASASSV